MKILAKVSALLLIIITGIACSNPKSENSIGDLSEIITDTTETFTYQLPSGKNIDLAYIYSGSEASVQLVLDGKKWLLPSKKLSDSLSIFENGNLVIKTNKTKIYFSNEQQPEVELVLVNPIFQSYESENENLLAVYHPLHKEKPIVILQREDGNEYTLTQNKTWEKGGIYSNDSLTWEVNENTASLKENNKTIVFKTLNLENIDGPLHK